MTIEEKRQALIAFCRGHVCSNCRLNPGDVECHDWSTSLAVDHDYAFIFGDDMDKSTVTTTRGKILDDAKQCVCSDRDKQYGKAEDSFQAIADMWNAYKPCGFTAHDVGMMMTLLKVARIKTGVFKEDSYVDAAGYLACAGEIACKESHNG